MADTPQNPSPESACPVPHSARSAWLSQQQQQSSQQSSQTLSSSSVPPNHTPSLSSNPDASACPVPHTARAVWLQSSQQQPSHPQSPPPSSSLPSHHRPTSTSTLNTSRVTSTIPRAGIEGSNSEHNDTHTEASLSGTSENWIYPSEEMFFNAMKRKSWDPQASDMKTIVPIHNAVNERAWAEIKAWEAGRGSESCGGPKLVSFSGNAHKLTPKARIMTLLGYHPPFDRHDWTVDRCGKKIDYVIDFYTGQSNPLTPGLPSFYLDVRPKLTPEGAWMRVDRWVRSFF